MIELWSDTQIAQLLTPERLDAIWAQSHRRHPEPVDYEGAEIKFIAYGEVTDDLTQMIVEARGPDLRATLFAAIDFDSRGDVGAIRQVRRVTEMKPVTSWMPVRVTR
ncbi:MAG: hypothetical protein EOO77_11955 [Oxalobacteraceae bacterium]|nr:MAG: hypothetical protein EOO77_11955 [Oxalobacteraceae bacterium]